MFHLQMVATIRLHSIQKFYFIKNILRSGYKTTKVTEKTKPYSKPLAGNFTLVWSPAMETTTTQVAQKCPHRNRCTEKEGVNSCF